MISPRINTGFCPRCNHNLHSGRVCGAPITETHRDNVGIFARPSGITRIDIVEECDCVLQSESC